MGKAILVGNGVTSQLIPAYRDNVMIEKFKAEEPVLYKELNSMLQPLRELPIKDQKNIMKILAQKGIGVEQYQESFVEQSLLQELYKPQIIAIETLLKVAQLFKREITEAYTAIIKTAKRIYYNDGNNGCASISKKNFSIQEFSNYINEFDFVFTTNFDSILDDAYKKEVMHLHGGFGYKNCFEGTCHWAEKTDVNLSPEQACLIWGCRQSEKERQTHGTFEFPISFPFKIHRSILENHMKVLKTGSYTSLEIWGYSGLNDGHINNAIKSNRNIREIIYYGDPECVNDNSYMRKISTLFVGSGETKHTIHVKSWNDIWNKFVSGNGA